MKAMLYVSVNFHHSFSFETNSSKTLKKVLQDTLHSEERRLTSFFSFLGAAKFLVGAYVLFIVFRYTSFTLLKYYETLGNKILFLEIICWKISYYSYGISETLFWSSFFLFKETALVEIIRIILQFLT